MEPRLASVRAACSVEIAFPNSFQIRLSIPLLNQVSGLRTFARPGAADCAAEEGGKRQFRHILRRQTDLSTPDGGRFVSHRRRWLDGRFLRFQRFPHVSLELPTMFLVGLASRKFHRKHDALRDEKLSLSEKPYGTIRREMNRCLFND